MSARTADDSFAWLEELLQQWGAWRQGGTSHLGIGSIYHRYQKSELPPGPVIDHGDPEFDRRMLDVDRAVLALPPHFQAVIKIEHGYGDDWRYRGIPRSIRARAASLQIAVQTYYNRRRAAYAELARYLRET